MPLLGKLLPGGKAYTYLPASVRRFPGAEELAGADAGVPASATSTFRLLGGTIVALHTGEPRHDHDAGHARDGHAAPGLEAYLEEVEERLTRTIESHPGLAAAVGADALAAGGKRLRPAARLPVGAGAAPSAVAAGVSVELVHMATLVHDDLIDGARVRRGRAAAWTAHGADAARAAGDYLFARAFAELAADRRPGAVAVLADACLALARGEALQRRQRHDPETTVDAYLERCALKTGKLFEAACVLGGGSGEYGLLLGIAFQIADDILDCTGRHDRDRARCRAPTFATARRRCRCCSRPQVDPVVRAALAGGSLDGVLVRVAASGALERSRAMALDYARRAREASNGTGRREELEALADAVVMRTG